MRKINKITPPLPSLPRRKKVAAYARVSVERDRTKHSLSAQVSYYSGLIQKNPEWEYVGVYADLGQTGTTDSRKEWKRMLADCEDGKIDIILVKGISRFARNTVDLLETGRRLKELLNDVTRKLTIVFNFLFCYGVFYKSFLHNDRADVFFVCKNRKDGLAPPFSVH